MKTRREFGDLGRDLIFSKSRMSEMDAASGLRSQGPLRIARLASPCRSSVHKFNPSEGWMWYKRCSMTSPQTGHGQTGLVRAIGRWSLAALAVNSIIGSGIFGLPATVAGLLGKRSVAAVLIAGAAMGGIIACLAEVASQFSEAGGPYLYARTAFGRLMGILVGWMLYLAQTAAPAANANLFVIYLAEFWPAAT